jgi:hypothetical protein
MKAHLFDLDTILIVNKMVWIIDKKNPNIPIIKITESDYNLIKKGIFKNNGERFYFGNKNYWIPKEISNELKIKLKKFGIDITNLSFSLREFVNSEVIGELEYEINYDILQTIKNTQDHIFFICSKNNKKNYERIIKKIEDKLYDMGLKIEDIYYLSETFFNRDLDEILYKKVRIILQKLLGFKTENNKFIDDSIIEYDEINYYDNELENINLPINDFLKTIIENSDEYLKNKIINKINSVEKTVYTNWVSPNKVNRIQQKKTILSYSKLIKTFESFKYLK